VKLLVAVLVAGLAALAMSAIYRGAGGPLASAQPPAGAERVATVEGREIPGRIYRMYLKNGIEALGLSDRTAEGRSKIELLKEGIVSELIDRALIESEARRRNISISDEALKAALDARVSQMGGAEKYKSYLAEHAISDADFRDVVRQELYGQLMQQELSKDVAVSPEEARDFYLKQKDDPSSASLFKEPEQVRASHILISARRALIKAELEQQSASAPAQVERAVAKEMEKRRARAAAVLARAKAGEDFAGLARQFSEDPGTSERGGDLGFFTRNAHAKGFDDAAFALAPGQVSGIVETDYGFHIIKLTGRKAARTRSFDEVRPAIEQRLLTRKRAERLTQWLEGRRREAAVQIDPQYKSLN
jgi:parvulin-like peptidyl-prolyl isomerase